MHVHLPKPLHGWREFAGEVGIIVLGVLIALGAQQVVETLQTHQRIRETRAALDSELSRDLAAFDWRIRQRPCIHRRIDELNRWANGMASGAPIRLKKEITPPIFFAVHMAVWQASDNEVGQMPVEAKLSYASIYEAMRALDEVLRDEQRAWTAASGYETDNNLTREELHAMRRAILDLQSDDSILDVFHERLRGAAAKLSIQPLDHIERGIGPQVARYNRALCQPLL